MGSKVKVLDQNGGSVEIRLDDLKTMMVDAVEESMEKHVCRMPISDNEAQQVRFFFDGIKARGGGNLHVGMERMFDNHEFVENYRLDKELEELKNDHEWVRKWRNKLDAAASHIGKTIIGVLVVAVLTMIGLGIKSHFNGGG